MNEQTCPWTIKSIQLWILEKKVDYIINNYYYKSPHKKAQGLKVLGKTPAPGVALGT